MRRQHPTRRSVLSTAAADSSGRRRRRGHGRSRCPRPGRGREGRGSARASANAQGPHPAVGLQVVLRQDPARELAAEGKKLGLVGIDLVGPDWFDTLKKHDLVGTMTTATASTKGLNRKENWDECLGKIREAIEATAAAGFQNVICFSGNRDGMDDEEGLKNCAEALKQVVGLAEEKKVTICMELLNSKVNHKDYMCDHTRVGRRAVQDGRLASASSCSTTSTTCRSWRATSSRTIRENKDYIGHYHTGGVPGRNEIDETQELYYPAIMKAIVDTGFKGYVAQEFIPKREPLASLRQAVEICDV